MSAITWDTVRRLGLGLREVRLLQRIVQHVGEHADSVFPVDRGDVETDDACGVLAAAFLVSPRWSTRNDSGGYHLLIDGIRIAEFLAAQPLTDEEVEAALADPRGEVVVHGYPVSPEARWLLHVSHPATVPSGLQERFDYACRVHRAAKRAEKRHGVDLLARLGPLLRPTTGFIDAYRRACEE